ncbi:alpha/beta fold hydrolase [Sneathiella sp. P13V-1]|uniref:alpha/beta fold hydrolase n=1 Tax=Sneathiella sp. P13V-1 TaxID=2697366 RepID=UPI00187B710D|nr:alpha/beta hydrolase [Sneathiella sp. P13V-1]MBE7638319.1 alpha/beta fold hydrolase [Sneathiella sp. P13V-1]
MSYAEETYKSNDGLNLYYRHYQGAGTKAPVVCLSGLTRNSGDFHQLAETYSKDRHFYALDYRGRGKSDYDEDFKNYNPQIYLQDILTFLSHTGIKRAVFVGTSLGGLLTMGLAGLAPSFVAGAVLNDVGPEIAEEGGSRIAGYVGKDVRFETIEQATAAQKEQYIGAYPDLDDEEWLATTKVGFIYDQEAGNFKPNYDLRLGQALAEQVANDQKIDLWPFFAGLKDIPTVAIRGELSDVLSEDVFKKMQQIHPNMATLSLPNRGHVPQLNEPPVINLLNRFFVETE